MTTEQKEPVPTQSEENKVSIKITDIYAIAQAMEMAIKRKVFTEEEVKNVYPSWNNVIRFCEDVKRKTEVEELYKKEEEKKEEDVLDVTPKEE